LILDDAFDPAQKCTGLHVANFSTHDNTHFGACYKSNFVTFGHFDFPSVIQGIVPNGLADDKKRDGNAAICVLRSDQASSTPMWRNKMTELTRGWMMMIDVGGDMEPCRKPFEEAANFAEAYTPFIKQTALETQAIIAKDQLGYLNDLPPEMLARIEQWEPAAVALEVTVSESGDIVAVKDRNIRFTAEEIYEIARMDLPPFMTGSVPSL